MIAIAIASAINVWAQQSGTNLMFASGLTTNEAALSASFGTSYDGEGSRARHANVLWGTNGLVSRTLGYWKDGIVSMFDYIRKPAQLPVGLAQLRRRRPRACGEIFSFQVQVSHSGIVA